MIEFELFVLNEGIKAVTTHAQAIAELKRLESFTER